MYRNWELLFFPLNSQNNKKLKTKMLIFNILVKLFRKEAKIPLLFVLKNSKNHKIILVISTVSFQFKEVPFFYLKSKIFDLRKILCSRSKNGNQKKISYVGEFPS